MFDDWYGFLHEFKSVGVNEEVNCYMCESHIQSLRLIYQVSLIFLKSTPSKKQTVT